MESLTYLPFDTHYLLVFIGAENLDTLAAIKMDLSKSKESGDEEEYLRKQQNVKEFLKQIREGIFGEKDKG